MVGLSKRLLVALSVLAMWPHVAAAGGGEFAGDGTRGMGRGGTGFLRADDPTVMLRNPALLADLWDDQAMIQSHLLMQDSCFHPTGAYGWELASNQASVVQFGEDEPITIIQDLGTDADGNQIIPVDEATGQPLGAPFQDERFAEICFEGPATFLPSAAIAVKLSDELGVGLGFFPPDLLASPQFGNRDGTVDTPQGRRPAETRWFSANRTISYFSLLGAVGWRPAPWLRIGAGFQWSLVAFDTTSFSKVDDARDPAYDLRTDVFGRDLFIPGFIGSVHVVPTDWLDIAIGYKWADRINTKGKLDLTLSPWGLDRSFSYSANGQMATLDPTPSPTVTPNQAGIIDAPPIWAPQLSFGVRISDRFKPRPRDWALAKESSEDKVEDHMANERWDLEANAIIFFNGVRNHTDFDTETAEVALGGIKPDGNVAPGTVPIGDCTQLADPNNLGSECLGVLRSRREHGGQTQYSFRVGGDYNLFPGMLALRAGVSYETRGFDVDYFDPTNYDMERIGLHAGFTLRVADKTDISFAYALFLIEDISLSLPTSEQAPGADRYPSRYRTPEYGYIADENGNQVGDFDGVARYEVQRTRRLDPGPFFANAGDAFFNLSVLSASVTQHF